MKSKNLLQLALVAIMSQAFFSCKSARDAQSASAKAAYGNYQYQELLTQRQSTQEVQTGTEQTVSDQQAPAKASGSHDETLEARALPKEEVSRQNEIKPSTKPVLSPKMKAALEKAKTAMETSKATGKKPSREVKKELRKVLRVAKDESVKADDQQVIEIILSFFIPPLAVYLHEDEINTKFWISLLLTLLFFLPGVIYALLVVTDTI